MTEAPAVDHLDEGPEKEIDAWTALLKVDILEPSITAHSLEVFIASQLPDNSPKAWKDQPLYADKVLQKIMRMSLMHGALHGNSTLVPESGFEIQPDYERFVSEKFTGLDTIHMYSGDTLAGKLLFAGKREINESIHCVGIYIPQPGQDPRPVQNIDEFFDVLGIARTQESLAIIEKEVLSRYTLEYDVGAHMPQRLATWEAKHNMIHSQNVRDIFLQVANRGNLFEDVSAVNALLEGLTTERHLGQHAFINDLDLRFRATALEAFKIPVLRIPLSSATYTCVDGDPRLRHDDNIDIAVHPTTVEALRKVMPDLELPITETYTFSPTVGARSGSLQIDGAWQDFQIKMDLIKFMSGWLRMCGTNALVEETEAAAFIADRITHGFVPPDSLHMMPTTEGALYNFGAGLNLATLARKIPTELQQQVLIPGAFLYSPDAISGRSFLADELIKIPIKHQDEFVREKLIHPIMSAWNYFLSLENPALGQNGLAFEMHGANFYYVWDSDTQTIRGDILTKDFASNRILRIDAPERSRDWLLGEYDHGLSHLFLTPLVEELSRITGKPTEYFDSLIVDKFSQVISGKNKQKFLVDGAVLSVHQDVFKQLQHFRSPRQKLWTRKPRFRPSDRSLYQ